MIKQLAFCLMTLATGAASAISAETADSIKNIVAEDSLMPEKSSDTSILTSGDTIIVLSGENARVMIIDDVSRIDTSPTNTADSGLMAEDAVDERITDSVALHVVPLVALVFGLPSLAILLIVWLILHFLHKRNHERNEIVSKAIDANYPLPDAFFSGNQSNQDVNTNETQLEEQSSRFFPTVPQSARNPRKFSVGITLICVGLPLFLFFLYVNGFGLAMIGGGVLIFVGIANIISYYCLPAEQQPRNTWQPPYNKPRNGFNNFPPPPPAK